MSLPDPKNLPKKKKKRNPLKDFPVPDIPEIEEYKNNPDNLYQGNVNLKRPNIDIPITPEQQREIQKCRNDLLYFSNNYMKISSIDTGVQLFKTYPYQDKMLHHIKDSRYSIFMLPRQMGKCVSADTTITVRNKKTNEIMNISIKAFMDMITEQNKGESK